MAVSGTPKSFCCCCTLSCAGADHQSSISFSPKVRFALRPPLRISPQYTATAPHTKPATSDTTASACPRIRRTTEMGTAATTAVAVWAKQSVASGVSRRNIQDSAPPPSATSARESSTFTASHKSPVNVTINAARLGRFGSYHTYVRLSERNKRQLWRRER